MNENRGRYEKSHTKEKNLNKDKENIKECNEGLFLEFYKQYPKKTKSLLIHSYSHYRHKTVKKQQMFKKSIDNMENLSIIDSRLRKLN